MEHYKEAKENRLPLCSPFQLTEALVKAATQQEQNLNNNGLADATEHHWMISLEVFFPDHPKHRSGATLLAYRMLSYSHRMPHQANPPWY